MLTMIQWLATFVSLLGAVVNIRKSRWGFVIWMGSCLLWVWWATLCSPIPIGFVITQVVFFIINMIGFRKWSGPAV